MATQQKAVLIVAGARSDSLRIVFSRCKGRRIGVQPSCKDSARRTQSSSLELLSRSLSYLKIVQASGMKACFQIPERSLSYLKIVQGERNQARPELLSRSLSYPKIEQTRGMKACFQIPECSLSYLKIVSRFGARNSFSKCRVVLSARITTCG